MNTQHQGLVNAQNGDIHAFHELFSQFQEQLKSYLYRLTADRSETEDLAHDTFVKAFDQLGSFQGKSSVKTWVFTIATNLARDMLKTRKQWPVNARECYEGWAEASPQIRATSLNIHTSSPRGLYEVREHIDFCFTCISKTLPLEHQLALILREIYDFTLKDITMILNMSLGVVKHLLHDARKTMSDVFDENCSLVNKQGTCYECSVLHGIFNPKQDFQRQRVQLKMVKASNQSNSEELLTLRTQLVKEIDPLNAKGTDLHAFMLQHVRRAVGEMI